MNSKEVRIYKKLKWMDRPYKMYHVADFQKEWFKDLTYVTKYHEGRYTDAVIMADCETSKDREAIEPAENHIVCWTMTVGAFNHPLFSILGRKPSELCDFIKGFMDQRPDEKLIIYYHNLAYDWVFHRGFFFAKFGFPVKILATKPHYPIYIEFANGLILKDSLILAQRKLEKWADDLEVPHRKATGKWDYDKRRDQNTPLSPDEEEYAEYDTLCGVECIMSTMRTLHKKIYSMPYTATGIPRQETRKRGGRIQAHEKYLRQVLTWQQQIKAEEVYHGGYVHGNPYYLGVVMTGVLGGDFTSSYPFSILTEKVPVEKFMPYRNCKPEEILRQKETYAFMFKLILYRVRLRPEVAMPILQNSKTVRTINAHCDNGRITFANYVEIYTSELTLDLIMQQYEIKKSVCIEVECASKGYIPKWFTDYVFECFTDKCKLKGKDPVLYSLAKSRTNSCYGLCVQRPVRELIEEIYEGQKQGLYQVSEQDFQTEYEAHVNRLSSILPYQWGVWITENSMYRLFRMGSMCDTWLYSDTDSVYGIGWHMDEVEAFNKECLEKLRTRGYDAVEVDGKSYVLGAITFDKDAYYDEFKYLGAKRYAGRNQFDHELHITVAGVPKKTGAACLKNDIDNFCTGFIFDGKTTGKLTHTYFFSDQGIHVDKWGNEICDSIDLSPCDYKLDGNIVENIDELFFSEVEIQVYDEL